MIKDMDNSYILKLYCVTDILSRVRRSVETQVSAAEDVSILKKINRYKLNSTFLWDS